jgi:hypothetical protein
MTFNASSNVQAVLRQIDPVDLVIEGDDNSWAAFSRDGLYRYALGRFWGEGELWPAPTMLFIGHNPSTADHRVDDPTLRKDIVYAKRERCGGVVLANVMAYRSTEKAGLIGRDIDPVGPLNIRVLRQLTRMSPIVAAWGRIDERLHARVVPALCLFELAGTLANKDLRVFCLGKNQDGSPKHPLYLPNAQPLEPWP